MHSADDWKQQERARRQRELARIIEPEFRPGRGLVVGDCGLARALRGRQVDAWGLGAEQAGGSWPSAGCEAPAAGPRAGARAKKPPADRAAGSAAGS